MFILSMERSQRCAQEAQSMSKHPVVTSDGRETKLWYSDRDGGSVGHEDVYKTDKNGRTQETNLHYDPKTGELHRKI